MGRTYGRRSYGGGRSRTKKTPNFAALVGKIGLGGLTPSQLREMIADLNAGQGRYTHPSLVAIGKALYDVARTEAQKRNILVVNQKPVGQFGYISVMNFDALSDDEVNKVGKWIAQGRNLFGNDKVLMRALQAFDDALFEVEEVAVGSEEAPEVAALPVRGDALVAVEVGSAPVPVGVTLLQQIVGAVENGVFEVSFTIDTNSGEISSLLVEQQ
jgi:hypothetical protein